MSAVSTRTPEGWPNKCSLCGAVFLLEPSLPHGDATCPQCGQLVWWFKERLQSLFGLTSDEFNLDAALVDLDRESLATVELVIEIEEEYGISLSDLDAEQIRTIGDAIREIRKRLDDEA
jgi:acyl carrier protein